MTTTEIDCPASAFQGCDIATCDRPCTARAGEISKTERLELRRLQAIYFIWITMAFMLIGVSIIGIAAIVVQGIENNRAVIAANQEN